MTNISYLLLLSILILLLFPLTSSNMTTKYFTLSYVPKKYFLPWIFIQKFAVIYVLFNDVSISSYKHYWEHDKWITNCKGMWTRQVVINLDSLISRSLTWVSEENHGKCDWGPSVSPANFTPGRYREGLCESVISLTCSSSIFTSWCLTWRLLFPLLNKYTFYFRAM